MSENIALPQDERKGEIVMTEGDTPDTSKAPLINKFSVTIAKVAAVALLTIFVVTVFQSASKPSTPFLNMLDAAKKGDKEAFWRVYSSRIKRGKDSISVSDFKEAQTSLAGLFPSWKTSDFRFDYSGAKTEGTLNVFFKGKLIFPFPVVKEWGAWKLDAH